MKKPKWVVCSYEALEAWRVENGLTKTLVADLLGITVGSYQHWSRGFAVPHYGTQGRIKELIKTPFSGEVPKKRRSAVGPAWKTLRGPRCEVIHAEAVKATAVVVTAWLDNHKLKIEEIPDLVGRVMKAFSS